MKTLDYKISDKGLANADSGTITYNGSYLIASSNNGLINEIFKNSYIEEYLETMLCEHIVTIKRDMDSRGNHIIHITEGGYSTPYDYFIPSVQGADDNTKKVICTITLSNPVEIY